MNPHAFRRNTVLVMHDDPLLAAGLVTALRQHGRFDVLQHGVAELAAAPAIDVVITDFCNAMHLVGPQARAAQRPLDSSRVLALTSNDREADIRRAIEAGVHGYVLLGVSLDELIEGVTTVANGIRYLGRSVAHRMADSLTRTSLTSREVDVLRLIVAGDSNKAIARQLQIEVGTVKSHVGAIMTKLGACSRTHAAGIATDRGLVEAHLPEATLAFADSGRRVEAQAQFA